MAENQNPNNEMGESETQHTELLTGGQFLISISKFEENPLSSCTYLIFFCYKLLVIYFLPHMPVLVFLLFGVSSPFPAPLTAATCMVKQW